MDAQYDAASAYIKSQAHAGWTLIRSRYDDGGYSGGSTDRPDLQRLLDDIRARKLDVIVVYKVDRLTRSLADFAKLVELFDSHGVSFVSVTQQFNTTTSMGKAESVSACVFVLLYQLLVLAINVIFFDEYAKNSQLGASMHVALRILGTGLAIYAIVKTRQRRENDLEELTAPTLQKPHRGTTASS